MLFSIALAAGGAAAQSTSRGSDPSQLEERIAPATAPRTEPLAPGALPAIPPPVPAEALEFNFVLSAVVFEGTSAFSSEKLAETYRHFIARRIGSAEIREIARAVTDLYRGEGYVFSTASIPPQDVVSGVVHVLVTEGYIEDVAFEGDTPTDGIIRDYFAPVLAERPTRLPTVERALMLLTDLAGVRVMDANISEGASPGGKKLTVRLQDKRLRGDLYVDNRGTPSSGRLQTWISGAAQGVTGVGSSMQIGLFTIPKTPKELRYLQGKWLQPIGPYGTTGEVTISGSVADAGADKAAIDTESKSFRITTKGRHPIYRSREQSAWAYAELDFNNLSERTYGTRNYRDRNRTARVGLEYYRSAVLGGDFYVNTAYSRGLDFLGASDQGDGLLSRNSANPDFDKVTLELRRLQKIGGGLAVFAHAKGQAASHELLTAEEFSLGGSQFGRAYDYGEISGRYGVGGLAELRYTKEQPSPWVQSYDVYGFYDAGATWIASSGREFLSSAGAGVRGSFAGDIYADIQLAAPLTRPVSNARDDDYRILFSFGVGL